MFMERAIKDLCQFSDTKLFQEVATGIGHIIDAVNELDSAKHKLLNAEHFHPARIIANLATEEAAKVLILVDAVRCPPDKHKEKSRTLSYFHEHLAKGIYAKVADWRPVNFAEIMSGVNYERREYYLDGPNDVDWIFPNSITQQREDDLYVGYVRDDTEEGGKGDRYWAPPSSGDHLGPFFGHLTPAVIKLARALHQVKATTPEGLSVVAQIWRPVNMCAEMQIAEVRELNLLTLKKLENRNLLGPATDEVFSLIRNYWIFPLWPLELQKLKVKKEDLREVRRQWAPGSY